MMYKDSLCEPMRVLRLHLDLWLKIMASNTHGVVKIRKSVEDIMFLLRFYT